MTGLLSSGHHGSRDSARSPLPSSLRSTPAQKTGSAAVRIITSTFSSASAAVTALTISSPRAVLKALRACGRFRVMVQMRSSVWVNKIGSVMRRLPPWQYVRRGRRAPRRGPSYSRRVCNTDGPGAPR
ncbi:Uncharacterised protein [Mycobacteroides abscessus subsp. abscessus]|nr:Uncharacterised protein [Mycobacteroides abscessus subsp. abscessus]